MPLIRPASHGGACVPLYHHCKQHAYLQLTGSRCDWPNQAPACSTQRVCCTGEDGHRTHTCTYVRVCVYAYTYLRCNQWAHRGLCTISGNTVIHVCAMMRVHRLFLSQLPMSAYLSTCVPLCADDDAAHNGAAPF